MATYVNDLRLKEITTGDEAGTWGTSTNTNLELIAEAFSFGTEAITTNADTHTTTIADGSTDPGRSLFLKYTGTLDSTCTITIGPNTVSKLWFIENATSGSQDIIISQGSGANVTIANGQTKAIYSDGAGSGAAMVDAFQDLSIPDLFIDDDLTFTSDSAVITFGADGDTTLTHTDGTGLTLNSTNKLTFGDAASFVQQSSDGVLRIDGEATIDLNASTAVTISNDLKLDSDSAVLGFGADNDTTLTHTDGSGLTLNSTNKIMFNDASQFIQGSSATVLSLGATDEIDLTATLIDINGNADVSGTVTAAGLTVDTTTLVVDATNNRVGIGTSSPDSPLEIQAATNSSSDTTYLKLSNAGENVGHIDFENGNGSLARITGTKEGAGASANDGILTFSTAFDTSLSERMRIDSSGNVGIGVSSLVTGSSRRILQVSTGSDGGQIAFADSTTEAANPRIFATNKSDLKLASANSGASTIQFITGTTTPAERMRIDSSGRVAIGHSSPSAGLDVAYGSAGTIAAEFKNASGFGISITPQVGGSGAVTQIGLASGESLSFAPNNAEAMRLDASGNLLVGTTDAVVWDNSANSSADNGHNLRTDGRSGFSSYQATAGSNATINVNRTGSDGDLIRAFKSGNLVGSIGTNGGFIYIEPQSSGNGLTFLNTSVSPCTSNGGVSDNFLDLGTLSRRFDDIYATNGTIQTSDRNEKQDIEALSDAEQRVAVAAKGLLKKFRWKSAVAEKGDGARIHFGIIAQDLQDAFTAEGLDAGRYAMFISSTWTDDDGNEQTRLGVRYSELLAFIISAI